VSTQSPQVPAPGTRTAGSSCAVRTAAAVRRDLTGRTAGSRNGSSARICALSRCAASPGPGGFAAGKRPSDGLRRCRVLHRLLLRHRVLDCEILKVAGQRTGPRQRRRSEGDRRSRSPSAWALVTATGELAALPRLESPEIRMASADRTRRPGLADISCKDPYHARTARPVPSAVQGWLIRRAAGAPLPPGSAPARIRRGFWPWSPWSPGLTLTAVRRRRNQAPRRAGGHHD